MSGIKGMRVINSGQFQKGLIPWNKKGRSIDGNYFKIITPDGRRIREHRYVMEKKLGRRLESKEIVHHIDGNGQNNNPKNLQVMDRSTHNRIDILHKRWGGIYG